MKTKLYKCFKICIVLTVSIYAIYVTGKSVAHKTKPFKKADYHLTIDYKMVDITGQKVQAMVVNDLLPAPTLYFKEGQKVVIDVTNKMDVESSIHWHGILLPNFQDGVPYLTTPPIKPGKTHRFTFKVKQSGTYWYHSHTGLQEQRGVYGAIVIEPKKKLLSYDRDLVLVLSDWTDEKPKEVLRTLKRANEWYAIKKGTALSLSHVIRKGALLAQLKMWYDRMPGIDISDVYYPAFLVNGKTTQHYPKFKGGQKVRVRIINASASTYFWLRFTGSKNQKHLMPLLVSADGVNVKPTRTNKILSAIAETYDLLVTIPFKKAVEIKAFAQDGSGKVSVVMGKGPVLKASVQEQPNWIQMMQDMAKHHSGSHSSHSQNSQHKQDNKHYEHSSHSQHVHNKHDTHNQHNKNQNSQHNRHHNKHNTHQQHSQYDKNKHSEYRHQHNNRHPNQHHLSQHHTAKKHVDKKQKHLEHQEGHQGHQAHQQHQQKFGYDHLKSLKRTDFPKHHSLKHGLKHGLKQSLKQIHLNLTGNMRRYVWSINNKTLSRSDKIKIKKSQTMRIHLHNKTMMHHPMHLHGHFFRVFNKHGAYSPLKHTVDVPPMQSVSIEFSPNEKGDWFFHCHVLYHMKSGMSRVFSLGDKRDVRLKNYPLSKIFNTDKQWYLWGDVSLMSHQINNTTVLSNTKNQISIEGVFAWVDNEYYLENDFEIETSYEYFFTNFFRLFAGVDIETTPIKEGGSVWGLWDYELPAGDFIGRAGIRYTLPFLIEGSLSLSHNMQLQLGLEYEVLVFDRTEFFVEWEWELPAFTDDNNDWDFTNHFINQWTDGNTGEHEWQVGLSYIATKNISLVASYSNNFSFGAGLNWKL